MTIRLIETSSSNAPETSSRGAQGGALPRALPDLLLSNAAADRRGVALRAKQRGVWTEWSWQEVADEVSAIAHGLATAGLKRGEQVLVLGDAQPRLLFGLLGAQLAGAVVTALPARVDAAALDGLLTRTAVRFAFAEDEGAVVALAACVHFSRTDAVIVHSARHLPITADALSMVHYDTLRKRGCVAATDPHFARLPAHTGANRWEPAFAVWHLRPGDGGADSGDALSHRALIDEAEEWLEPLGVGNDDDLLLHPGLFSGDGLALAIAHWLAAGLRLNIPENANTWLGDRRELGPTYELGDTAAYEAVYDEVCERLPNSGSRVRRVIEAVLDAGARVNEARASRTSVAVGDRLKSLLLGWLVVRPLRDVLGLSRVRVAVHTGVPLSASAAKFYRSLGIRIEGADRSARSHGEPESDTVRDPAGEFLASMAFSADVISFFPTTGVLAVASRAERGGSVVVSG